MNDPQPALGDGLTGAELEDAEHADLLKRSIRGANVLLVRGLLLRVISASTNFALIALVLPAELGIFAVVRGALSTVQFITELGFELAMIRRRDDPTPEMMAAVAGLRTLLLIAILVLVVALWFLMKFVIGIVAGIATFVAVIVAIGAVFWAVKRL